MKRSENTNANKIDAINASLCLIALWLAIQYLADPVATFIQSALADALTK